MSDSGKAPAVMGFCMGGTLAWAVAAAGEPSCCVSYYGSGVPDMLGMLDQVTCPTLFHFGNADAYIPNEGVDALSAAIAGRDGFFLNVEDAGHAFDNHESAMFWNEAAAKSAWAKTMSFLTEHA
jgi:carboxymethylenebutenolidase